VKRSKNNDFANGVAFIEIRLKIERKNLPVHSILVNEGVEGGSSTRFDEAGPAGEQGQQQHEGRVTLAPSATARLSYSPWPVG